MPPKDNIYKASAVRFTSLFKQTTQLISHLGQLIKLLLRHLSGLDHALHDSTRIFTGHGCLELIKLLEHTG